MIGLIQRVNQASVSVADTQIAAINQGITVLLGIERGDNEAKAEQLLKRILGYRIFEDENGKMNLNVQQINGSLLVVSQFTLAANTRNGMRPSFSKAAPPEQARTLYEHFVSLSRQQITTETGEFAADMQVSLVNDGPVTFYLQT